MLLIFFFFSLSIQPLWGSFLEVIRWGVRYAEMARSWGIASDKIRESQKTQSKAKQKPPQSYESERAMDPRWSYGCSKEWITFLSVAQHRVQCVLECVDPMRGEWWKLFIVSSSKVTGTLPTHLLQSPTTASLPMSKRWHWQWSQPGRVLWDSVELLRLWYPISRWCCGTPEPCLPCFLVVCYQRLPITVPDPLTIEFVLHLR